MTKILLSLSALAMVAAVSTAASAGQVGVDGGFAAVRLDGSLQDGVNIKGIRHIGPGKYLVRFNNDVSACSLQVTVTGHGKSALQPAYIVAGHRTSSAVVVETFANTTLLPSDFPFDLKAGCDA